MKKIILICFTFFIVFTYHLFIYSQQQELQPDIEIPEEYVFYHYSYVFLDISLIYPENWINYSSQERGILIYTPDSKGVVMLLGTPLFGEEYALEKLWTENMENLKSGGAIFQEISPATLSGYPAIKALYTIKIGNSIHQYIRYSALIGDLFYTFSFHAPGNDFKKYLTEVLTIVDSITIKTVE
ncbi:MAG: hypothetical protein Kow00103_11860 [Candidatus Caldatribacteriota bacterium]